MISPTRSRRYNDGIIGVLNPHCKYILRISVSAEIPGTWLIIRDLKQTGRQRDDDGYSHNDIPDLVQKK